MKYQLYKYQEKAVKNLIKHSINLLNSSEKDKYILLKAITGSGKTVISGAYMEEMFNECENLAFIWISVGRGGLHLQSRSSLIEKLNPSISVKLIDEALRNESLYHKDVLILNWEGLNTTKVDPETKEVYFDNIVMREGEQRNFQELCLNTIENGTKIILVIDESHNTAKSKTSKAIVDLINPSFTLEITATPHKERIPNQEDAINKKAFFEVVRTLDVIEEGVIKKSIILNDVSKEKEDMNSSLEFILKQAILKRNELKIAYDSEKEDINPLCIIQLPDGKLGDELKKEVLGILNDNGYSQSNDKVAIWLHGEETHDDTIIKSFSSPIDFLIFKQAVATGWDCPRASILVKLRNTKSTIFDLQTVGRILRMPKRKHYTREVLNNGYVFTNSDYSINTGDYDQVLPIRQILRKEFRDEILALKFEIEKIEISKHPIDTRMIELAFEKKMQNQSINLNLDELILNIKKSTTQTSEFDKSSNEEVKFVLLDEMSIKLTKQDVNREFEKLIKSISNSQYPYKNVNNIIKRYFNKIEELQGNYTKQKQIALLNKDLVIQCFNEIKSELKNKVPVYIKTSEFFFKEDRHTSEKDTISYKKCAYYKHFISKYETETTFEKYLEELDSVYYWIKNVDSGDGISIVYDYKNVKHEFYPDYVVRFKDKSIGLYEVKHIDDSEKDTITKAKIEVLKDYSMEHGYKCGKIEIKDNKVYLPTLPKELK